LLTWSKPTTGAAVAVAVVVMGSIVAARAQVTAVSAVLTAG